jgi:hypothetical protein
MKKQFSIAKFWFCVARFDSSVAPLIFADQFIKFSTRLSSPLLYGLGEHKQPLLLNVTNQWQKLTFWTRDVGPSPNTNLYGHYIFPSFFSNDLQRNCF